VECINGKKVLENSRGQYTMYDIGRGFSLSRENLGFLWQNAWYVEGQEIKTL
jgi:hypothetical protein